MSRLTKNKKIGVILTTAALLSTALISNGYLSRISSELLAFAQTAPSTISSTSFSSCGNEYGRSTYGSYAYGVAPTCSSSSSAISSKSSSAVVSAYTLGTQVGTAIIGVVGTGTLPQINMSGGNIPNGTAATFTPAGSTTAIAGVIFQGNFIPSTGQFIPANATTGVATGTLIVSGVPSALISTNFSTAPTSSSSQNTNSSTTSSQSTVSFSSSVTPSFGSVPATVSGQIGNPFLEFPLSGSNIPNGTPATFQPAGSSTIIYGYIISGIFVPVQGSIIPADATLGSTNGTLKSNNVANLLIPTNFTPASPVQTNLQIRVNLSGPFDTNTNKMKTTLRANNKIPTVQPYSQAPFNYSGNEITSIMPESTVDWVLMEIKNSTGTSVLKKALLVDADGNLFDATTPILPNNITLGANFATGQYNIIIRHRNHLAISTNTPITITNNTTTAFDFTSNANVKSGNQLQMSSGKYAMYQNNPDGDTQIYSADRSIIQNSPEYSSIYSNNDINLDTVVDSLDRSISQLSPEVTESIN